MPNTGQLYQKLVAGDTFNIATVLNNQSNRMIERMNIECNTVGSSGITIQLPTFAQLGGLLNFEVVITDTGNNAATRNITVLPGAANTINQNSSLVINTNKGGVHLIGGTQTDWGGFLNANQTSSGSGSVTSFSSGNLSPLFTTSVATATSTPALSFTLADQAANTFFAGPASTLPPAPPTFRALVLQDLPVGTGTVTSFSSGNLSPLFTTNVATAASTPALSFALSNTELNFVFAGPSSGAPGAPSFRALVGRDLPLTPRTGALTLDAINYLELDINGTGYKIALVTSA
jgi:hypothetical protein